MACVLFSFALYMIDADTVQQIVPVVAVLFALYGWWIYKHPVCPKPCVTDTGATTVTKSQTSTEKSVQTSEKEDKTSTAQSQSDPNTNRGTRG